MSIVRTVAKNTSFLILAKGISLFLGLILTIFIARYIGAVGFGKLGFAQTFTGLLVILADMGLVPFTIREIARRKELASKYLGNIFFIKLIFSVITFALIVIIINLMHYPIDTKIVIYLIGISSIFGSFSDFMRAIFKAFERMEYESFLDIGKTIITIIIGLTVLISGYGLIAIALVYCVVAFIDLLATLVVTVKKFARPEMKIDLSFCRGALFLAFPFIWTVSIGVVYHQIDIVMLSIMKGDAPVGWYNAACKIIYTLVIIPEMFTYAIFPAMSRFYLASKDDLITIVEKSAKYLFMIGLPLAVGAIILAKRIILLLYGQNFIPSIMAMQVLALYLPLRFMNYATGYTLSSIDKEHLRALSATIAAVGNIGLNLILIPRYSLVGAAIATAITEVILFVSYYYFVARHLCRLRMTPIFAKPILACMIMGIFVFCLKELNLALLIVLATVVYPAVIYFVKGFDSLDKAVFKELIEGIAVGTTLNNRLVKVFYKK